MVKDDNLIYDSAFINTVFVLCYTLFALGFVNYIRLQATKVVVLMLDGIYLRLY